MKKILPLILVCSAFTALAQTGCDTLFFSEYAEGSSNHKYIEIYNPSDSAISLSGYTIYASGNGGSWTNSFTSNATIASGDVYMIANSSLDSATQSLADTSLSYPSIVHYNGDDALILTYGTDTIDVIGVPGVDPGSSWSVGTGSTANHTLVRKYNITHGS
ncbi:MAG TPA: DNA degradation protein EddB, partial [Cryomorphaceae bacterium]|nr:DNA degradation protein EddB [Cryomorphaceae bacterium]